MTQRHRRSCSRWLSDREAITALDRTHFVAWCKRHGATSDRQQWSPGVRVTPAWRKFRDSSGIWFYDRSESYSRRKIFWGLLLMSEWLLVAKLIRRNVPKKSKQWIIMLYSYALYIHTVFQKNRAPWCLIITLANLDRFSKLFHQEICKEILYVHVAKIST